jgi:hypothetical protein
MDITRGTHAAPDDFTVNSRAVPRDPSIARAARDG